MKALKKLNIWFNFDIHLLWQNVIYHKIIFTNVSYFPDEKPVSTTPVKNIYKLENVQLNLKFKF